jgi:hypothetical protein
LKEAKDDKKSKKDKKHKKDKKKKGNKGPVKERVKHGYKKSIQNA